MENFKKLKLFRVVNYATYLLILLVLIAALFDQKILEDIYFRWVFYMLVLETWITVVSRNEENG